MKIHRPGSGVLIVEHRPLRPRVVGTLLLTGGVAGACVAARVLPRDNTAIALVAVLVAITGALVLQASSSRAMRLNRVEGYVELRARHLMGTTAVVHRLADVGDVVLERRMGDNDRSLFRLAMVMRDGTHRGWGVSARRPRADQIAAVEALREFLGTARAVTAFDGTVAFPRPVTVSGGWQVPRRGHRVPA